MNTKKIAFEKGNRINRMELDEEPKKNKFLKENKIVIAIIISAFIMGLFIFSASIYNKESFSGFAVSGTDFEGLKTVTKIIDGDTIIVEGESVRLLGIDTDEKGYDCYDVAKKRIEELVLGKEVRLEEDASDKDQYGRYLRYIFLENYNINLQMVQEGLAVARFSPENTKHKQEILEAEKYARDNEIGCKWERQKQILSEPRIPSESSWKKLTSGKTGLEVIGACNAGNHIEKEKIVEGRIIGVYKSKTNTVFMNFEKPYPNSCFTAVIFSSSLYKFPENINDYFENKNARVKGIIKEYEGKSEIILESFDQIEVL